MKLSNVDYKSLRELKQITVDEISKALDLSLPTIYALERQNNNPKLDTLINYLEKLGYELYVKDKEHE